MVISEKINNSSLRATPQRRLVYKAIGQLCHCSIDQIIDIVHQQSPVVTVSTIYRIMDSFCAVGLVGRLTHPSGKIYYDINPCDHHHIYTSDDRIVDFVDDQLSEFISSRIATRLDSDQSIGRISIQVITQKH